MDEIQTYYQSQIDPVKMAEMIAIVSRGMSRRMLGE